MKTLIKKKVLNTGEEIEVDSNTCFFETQQFFRISVNMLMAVVEYWPDAFKRQTGVVYMYQKYEDGSYSYAGTIEIRPLKTKLKVTSVKTPMQLRVYAGLGYKGASDRERYNLIFEESDFKPIVIPEFFKYVFGV